MKIAISAGHYPERPGAIHSQLTEHHESILIASMVVNMCRTVGISGHMIGTGGLRRKKIPDINAGGFDLGIEIHLNDGGGTGSETLYCSPAGKRLAKEIQDCIVLRTGLRNRGIKIGYYKMDSKNGLDYILEKTNCPFVIVEPFFLDSAKDRTERVNHYSYQTIAAAIVEGIIKY